MPREARAGGKDGEVKGEDAAALSIGSVTGALRELLGLRRTYQQVAALPWRASKRGIQVMLVTSRDTGRWVLPKGWPEGGEALWDAAAREAGEEAGITGTVTETELGCYRYNKARRSGADLTCEVVVFPLKVHVVADKWPERKQRRRAWFSPAEAASKVQEPELAALIAEFDASRSGDA